MSEHDDLYRLEPEPPKRGPAPPTRPDTVPGGTGDPLIDESIRRRQASRSLQDSGADIVRQAYLRPVLMTVIGLSITCMILMAADGLPMVIAYLVSYGVSVPIGVGVFLLFCLLWIGFDTPIHLIVLELAGIYAVTDATRVGLGIIPGFGGILMLIVPVLLYVWLLTEILEIELVEAVVVGIATFLIKIVLMIMLIAAMI